VSQEKKQVPIATCVKPCDNQEEVTLSNQNTQLNVKLKQHVTKVSVYVIKQYMSHAKTSGNHKNQRLDTSS